MGRRIIAIFAAAVLALVGVGAVLLYVNAADARAVAGQQPVSVYIAKTMIPSGTTVKDAVKNGSLVKTSVAAKGAPSDVLSKVDDSNNNLLALTDIQPGEYVLNSRFGTTPVGTRAIEVPAGQVAVSVELADAARVGTFVTPGSRVVIMGSFSDNEGQNGTRTKVILDNVLVIAVGQSSLVPGPAPEGGVDGSSGTASLVTVAVSPTDSIKLVHGVQTGKLYAALRGTDAKVDLAASVTDSTLLAAK
jgi:pilus assembly protein CpaB